MKELEEKFFKDMGFEKIDITYPFGTVSCYKDSKGSFYRLDHFSKGYVIEYASNEDEARKNCFEDTDLFDDNVSETELVKALEEWFELYG